ncbi:hypothetical protein MGA3_00575 [Bacillus methanolicus MGA3]|nr:hypothetical protein MGA3_00575 [Bacillus methanolicus MGA3]
MRASNVANGSLFSLRQILADFVDALEVAYTNRQVKNGISSNESFQREAV